MGQNKQLVFSFWKPLNSLTFYLWSVVSYWKNIINGKAPLQSSLIFGNILRVVKIKGKTWRCLKQQWIFWLASYKNGQLGASWISRWSELLETGLAFIILFILKINVPTALERNKKGDLVIQVGFKTYKKSVIKRSFLATLFITFCLTPQHFYRRQFQGPSNRKWLDAYLYW